jgi:hypothetical protein
MKIRERVAILIGLAGRWHVFDAPSACAHHAKVLSIGMEAAETLTVSPLS